MQLRIVNQDYLGIPAGGIRSVMPDTHAWSPLVVASLWLARDPIGLPEEYRDDLDSPPGTFPRRTVANFPNPHFAVAQFPSHRCDLNLAAAWLDPDPDEVVEEGTIIRGPCLWYLDLNALPPGVANSLRQPGGQAQLGDNRLSAIKNFYDGTPITDVLDWEDKTKGNSPEHFPGSGNRSRMGEAAAARLTLGRRVSNG